jgi:hypothetical protein
MVMKNGKETKNERRVNKNNKGLLRKLFSKR